MPYPPFAIRTECPPGACVCGREALLNDPDADLRVLRLTRDEEKRLPKCASAMCKSRMMFPPKPFSLNFDNNRAHSCRRA